MIVWINGSYGSGKKSVSDKLKQKIEGSCIFDLEELGEYLRYNLPKSVQTDDFRDMPLWREMAFQILLDLAKNYKGVVIVPMRLVNVQYFDEVVNRLKASQVDIRHYYLKVNYETLKKRLIDNGNQEGEWVFEQLERDAKVDDTKLVKVIKTDRMTVDAVVNKIYKEVTVGSMGIF